MTNVYECIQEFAKGLGIDSYASDLTRFINAENMSTNEIEAVYKVFAHLSSNHDEAIEQTLLKMSRLPLKVPKTFENFDFSCVHSKDIDRLKNLPTLSDVFSKRNIAFIGPQGVGKTHLAQAYGRKCCSQHLKTYFLKASELNQKFIDAAKYGRTGSVINGLVKPTCLIIDEIGRCVFNKESTRLFFDMIDRRYNKEGASTMIFTSNKTPDTWSEFFSEDSSLLCALDRLFDEAVVFMMRGESYRGKHLETLAIEVGQTQTQSTI